MFIRSDYGKNFGFQVLVLLPNLKGLQDTVVKFKTWKLKTTTLSILKVFRISK